jgi:hypothetical protein
MIAHAGRTEGVDTRNLPKRPAAIPEPVLKARGYFLYAPQTSSNGPAMAALRRWLVDAGRLAETEFPAYLSGIRADRPKILV